VLTFGAPDEVRDMVRSLRPYRRYPGFAIASGGGLHGSIPLANLEAYFDARRALDATPAEWRSLGRYQGRES